MNNVIVKCDQCKGEYFGELYDSVEKKGQHGKYVQETYLAQCVNCDKQIFSNKNKPLYS